MGLMINQYEIVLVNLDPTIGSEISKTRPCVIISPDEINHHLKTLLIIYTALLRRGVCVYPKDASKLSCC